MKEKPNLMMPKNDLDFKIELFRRDLPGVPYEIYINKHDFNKAMLHTASKQD
jgi:hypothetical protein